MARRELGDIRRGPWDHRAPCRGRGRAAVRKGAAAGGRVTCSGGVGSRDAGELLARPVVAWLLREIWRLMPLLRSVVRRLLAAAPRAGIAIRE